MCVRYGQSVIISLTDRLTAVGLDPQVVAAEAAAQRRASLPAAAAAAAAATVVGATVGAKGAKGKKNAATAAAGGAGASASVGANPEAEALRVLTSDEVTARHAHEFTAVCAGHERFEVCRMFLATLQLVSALPPPLLLYSFFFLQFFNLAYFCLLCSTPPSLSALL